MSDIKLSGLSLIATLMAGTAFAETEITYWSFWNEPEPQAQVLKALMDEYSAANPDVTFNVVWNGRQNQTTVRNALAGGTSIDLMDADMDGLNGGLVGQGAAIALDDLVASDSPDGGTVGEAIYPALLANAELNGSVGQLPYAFYTYQIFYNAAQMRDAGVSATPATWAEYMDAMKAVQASGVNAIAVESDIAFYNINWFNYLLARIAGPDFVLKAAEDKTGETWRDPAVRQALELEAALWADGLIPEESKGYQWPAGQQTLAFGETATELVGSWLPIELADQVDEGFEWGAMNFPMVEGGKGDVNDTIIYAVSFAIPDGAEDADAAQDFIRFALSKSAQQKMADDALIGVANASVEWADVISDSREAVANATSLLSENLGLKVAYADYSSNIYEAMHNKVFLGQISIDEFVDGMVEQTKGYWENR
ncbi:extracellular solute-binding protein [Ruegeria sp.]|uniref:ABC transporter substrate-binding protein n=1 Tax=Ruegeria sp. TaxID=1879320 RepID=UPI00231C0447|nr:extracellular solute-binding protein [Ruegeria sp.]MDA7963475.1 extracellular solute-binding protein [Ruegeria sp.]